MTTTPKAPTDRKRPSHTRKETRKTQEKRDEALEQGIAFTDDDGTRLQVRVRDVKGRHDAQLVDAIGLDFMGLLEALSQRQGLDLLAAVVWFGRLVNGREAGTYADTVDDFGYGDVIALDVDDAKAEDDRPEA